MVSYSWTRTGQDQRFSTELLTWPTNGWTGSSAELFQLEPCESSQAAVRLCEAAPFGFLRLWTVQGYRQRLRRVEAVLLTVKQTDGCLGASRLSIRVSVDRHGNTGMISSLSKSCSNQEKWFCWQRIHTFLFWPIFFLTSILVTQI